MLKSHGDYQSLNLTSFANGHVLQIYWKGTTLGVFGKPGVSDASSHCGVSKQKGMQKCWSFVQAVGMCWQRALVLENKVAWNGIPLYNPQA